MDVGHFSPSFPVKNGNWTFRSIDSGVALEAGHFNPFLCRKRCDNERFQAFVGQIKKFSRPNLPAAKNDGKCGEAAPNSEISAGIKWNFAAGHPPCFLYFQN